MNVSIGARLVATTSVERFSEDARAPLENGRGWTRDTRLRHKQGLQVTGVTTTYSISASFNKISAQLSRDLCAPEATKTSTPLAQRQIGLKHVAQRTWTWPSQEHEEKRAMTPVTNGTARDCLLLPLPIQCQKKGRPRRNHPHQTQTWCRWHTVPSAKPLRLVLSVKVFSSLSLSKQGCALRALTKCSAELHCERATPRSLILVPKGSG